MLANPDELTMVAVCEEEKEHTSKQAEFAGIEFTEEGDFFLAHIWNKDGYFKTVKIYLANGRVGFTSYTDEELVSKEEN